MRRSASSISTTAASKRSANGHGRAPLSPSSSTSCARPAPRSSLSTSILPNRTAPRRKLLLPLLAQNGSWRGGSRAAARGAARSRQTAGGGDASPPGRNRVYPDRSRRNPAAALRRPASPLAGDDPLGHVDSFSAAVSNLPELEAAAAGNGFLNQYLDWDHVVRRVPLILRLGDKPYPSLAAEALRVALGAPSYVGRAAGANAEKSFRRKYRVDGDPHRTADDADRCRRPGVASLRAVPQRDRFVSASRRLGREIRSRPLRRSHRAGRHLGRRVVNDLQATPIARDVPGVEIHAQLIEQILQGDFLVRPDWAVGAEILFALLVGIALILACRGSARCPARSSAVLR